MSFSFTYIIHHLGYSTQPPANLLLCFHLLTNHFLLSYHLQSILLIDLFTDCRFLQYSDPVMLSIIALFPARYVTKIMNILLILIPLTKPAISFIMLNYLETHSTELFRITFL